ncbi:hypothetical protein [Aeromicrobium sp. 9AM]|uniref:hypothetical protein n=1 Tax=Aeromicrobium sp. 9AM TaxID=2653126 RepID=UPI0012F1DCFD|nr:hypothetical protein [Aeromicrobium sp. 9AM]VXC21475.1 hypothetical protein AERO9AM_50382 [Aeromicrobium sp. 9AM]
MTLTRPAYKVIVENVTAGWTYECTQDDDSTLVDDVQLADGFTMSWAFANGETPGQLEPDQVTFRLVGTSAAVLPSMDIGDEIVAQLLRPTAGDPITYMKFLGRMTEPAIEPIGKDRILATVTANGHLAVLAGNTISDRKWPEAVTFDQQLARYERIAQLAKINLSWPVQDQGPLGALEVDSRSALDTLVELANGQAFPGFLTVLRVVKGETAPAQWNYDPNSDILYAYDTMDNDQSSIDAGDAPYKLVKVGLVAELARQALDVDDVRQISASVMDLDPGWRKDRADAVNQIVFQGISPLSDTDSNAAVIAQHDDLVAKYGPNPRNLDSQQRDPAAYDIATIDGDFTYAEVYLPSYDDALPDWSVDKVTIRTELMTDAELDRYAPIFYPTPSLDFDPAELTQPARLIIADVVDRLAVNGAAITGFLIGCSFQITGGELTIVPQLRNEAVAPSTINGAITPATLAASPTLAATTVANVAALHIDPTIRVRDIALASL